MRTFILLVCLFWVIGCTADENPVILDRDFTNNLIGAYQVTYYKQGTQAVNLPTATSSGVVDITKIDFTHIQAKLTMTNMGVSSVYSTNTFELQRSSTDAYLFNVLVSGVNVGTITGTAIDVQGIAPDGSVTQLKAKR